MREFEIEYTGLNTAGQNITELRYANDAVLISDSIENTRQILTKVDGAERRTGLHLNVRDKDHDRIMTQTW